MPPLSQIGQAQMPQGMGQMRPPAPQMPQQMPPHPMMQRMMMNHPGLGQGVQNGIANGMSRGQIAADLSQRFQQPPASPRPAVMQQQALGLMR